LVVKSDGIGNFETPCNIFWGALCSSKGKVEIKVILFRKLSLYLQQHLYLMMKG